VKAFKGITEPDPTVLEKANYQPEFKHRIWEYLDSRVNPYTVGIGKDMLRSMARRSTRSSGISASTSICSPGDLVDGKQLRGGVR
jgi:hypothetical protein